MKRFKEFINESNNEDFISYINEIRETLRIDFEMDEKQIDVYIEEFEESFKDSYENGVSVKDALIIAENL